MGKLQGSSLALSHLICHRTNHDRRLTGMFDDFGPDWAVIDVGGVGYLVHCSAKTLGGAGRARRSGDGAHRTAGQRERHAPDRLRRGAEREWFRLLTGVQGVGSKMALAVLSALSTEELQRACAGGDAATVARAQGVGPKLASRIVNELKDKAGHCPPRRAQAAAWRSRWRVRPARTRSRPCRTWGSSRRWRHRRWRRRSEELGEGAGLNELVRVALRRAAG